MALGLMAVSAIAAPPSGPGDVTVGTDVSSWNVGSGQFNGQFVTVERNGIEVGLRAQQRFVGPLPVTPNQNGKVGIYEAATGVSSGTNNGTWNYDWHVDLANAKGVAKGTTLSDYTVVLEQDYAPTVFGQSSPVDLTPFEGPFNPAGALFQGSFNPGFGNVDYDPNVERTYNLRLVVTPETFNGPALAVTIEVNVTA